MNETYPENNELAANGALPANGAQTNADVQEIIVREPSLVAVSKGSAAKSFLEGKVSVDA